MLNIEELDFNLIKKIPVDLMFSYNFVPLKEKDGILTIAVPESFEITLIDELEIRLGKRITIQYEDQEKIKEILKKSESSQRALEEASSELKLQIVKETEDGEDVL